MFEVDHYRFQADRARRMADRVTDALVKQKLLEMEGVDLNRRAADEAPPRLFAKQSA